jgi:hypothetical protein
MSGQGDSINIPRLGNVEDAVVFTARGLTSDTGDWQHWQKPRNAKMVFIFCVSGGGGGGGGFSAAAGNTRGGGGGGASGSVSRLIIPAFMLPDIIWAHPGRGGAGGAAGVGGSNASESYVAIQPDGAGSSVNLIARAGLGSPAGGGAGTGGAAGAGGTGGGAATATTATYFGAGIFQSNNGAAGSSGGSQNGTPGQTVGLGSIGINFTGGSGGGGTGAGNGDNEGGAIQLAGLSNADVPGGVAAAGAGNHGIMVGLGPAIALADLSVLAMLNNFGHVFFTGGTGGGTAGTAGTAGRGGDGSYGCGGGGGGGGVTGGAGGNGGDGLVIIVAW